MKYDSDNKKPRPPVRHFKPKAVTAMGNPLVETSFKMDPLELKLFVFVCSLVHEEHNFYTYSFTVEQAAKALGRKYDREHQRFYDDLKAVSKSILKQVVELPGFIAYEGASPCDRQTNLFDFFDYRKGEGRVEVGLKDWLKPYLLDLKKEFTRIAVREFARLQSFYGLKLFMLLQQYIKLGRRKFTVDELRYSLGVGDKEYQRWDSFATSVLNTAINDMRRADLLEVDMIYHKRGRKIYEVEFKFSKPGEERNETPSPKDLEDQAWIDANKELYETKKREIKLLPGIPAGDLYIEAQALQDLKEDARAVNPFPKKKKPTAKT